ncbi:MAG: hypothetical protein R6U64_05585 [Bacteroidales bacterium]
MQTSKSIATILYWASRLLAVVYALLFLYSAFCLMAGVCVKESSDGTFMHILVPFSDARLMNIDNNLPYKIFSFLVPLGLYTLFFYLTANVLQVFAQNRFFTRKNLKHLVCFYRGNLFIPLPVAFLSSFFVEVTLSVWMLVFVHFISGIFVYFMAQIFYQGLGLEDERDLII